MQKYIFYVLFLCLAKEKIKLNQECRLIVFCVEDAKRLAKNEAALSVKKICLFEAVRNVVTNCKFRFLAYGGRFLAK